MATSSITLKDMPKAWSQKASTNHSIYQVVDSLSSINTVWNRDIKSIINVIQGKVMYLIKVNHLMIAVVIVMYHRRLERIIIRINAKNFWLKSKRFIRTCKSKRLRPECGRRRCLKWRSKWKKTWSRWYQILNLMTMKSMRLLRLKILEFNLLTAEKLRRKIRWLRRSTFLIKTLAPDHLSMRLRFLSLILLENSDQSLKIKWKNWICWENEIKKNLFWLKMIHNYSAEYFQK